MSAKEHEAVAGDWQSRLQEKIQQIQQRGGPRPQGESIFIPAVLNESEVERIIAVAGQVNDLPFGTAPAGTLEIQQPPRSKNGTVQLEFVFRPSPTEAFGSSKGPRHARGSGGKHPSVLVGIDFNALPGRVFFMERGELEAIKNGLRHDAVVPIRRDVSIAPGERVVFVAAKSDPFGNPIFVPGGDSLSVTLIDAIDQDYPWAGRRLYRIVWDPDEVRTRATGEPPHATPDRAKAGKG